MPERPAPVLVMGHNKGVWLERAGAPEQLDREAALALAQATPPILCHAPAVARRLGCGPFPAYALLELFAFVRPGAFCVPTPLGLAQALGLAPPKDLGESAESLAAVTHRLLEECAARLAEQEPACVGIAWVMAQAGWRWGPAVLGALGAPHGPASQSQGSGLDVWTQLPEWEEPPPAPPPGTEPVDPALARARLSDLPGEAAAPRPQQSDYASALAQAFRPRDSEDDPIVVLAEAGTGVGKTLGYIAPASLWSEANQGAVWISTYTRNLQHQIDQELDRLYPEPQEKSEQVVIRKGRENYLCLLNFEEAAKGPAAHPGDTVAAGLMARWAAHSRDGDMVGGDFPGWLPELIGRGPTLGLTDRRGECIYSACQHYRKCFIERGIRRARHAAMVVANHALVMIQAARGAAEEGALPSHLVFDEGHHLFDAADSAFSAHLSGQETQELRRWLLGAETRGRSTGRLRGLRRRLEDVVAGDDKADEALQASLAAARALVSEGWQQRLRDGASDGASDSPAEAFLRLVRDQVYARARNPDGPYSLETEPRPPLPGLLDAAAELEAALARLAEPLRRLNHRLAARLEDDADSLNSETRRRIDGACRSLRHRAIDQITAWRDMLAALASETPPEFVDWLEVTRSNGRDLDVGLHRHWTDPTRPFAEAVLSQAQATAITSATLTDGTGDTENDWAAAEMRTGAVHLATPAVRVRVPSPFDYAGQTRVLIVGDVRKDDIEQVAAAYRELFRAADGGGLGLFTAIARLRAVHQRIAAPLEEAGIPLFAQHVDRMDTATLVDIFRAEENTCLLGTDAVRDGVDVPGRALRLIVFDRVPWPRPDIRHRARRKIFGGRAYDDMLTRLKLKQAYGRLIRRADDHGVFVLLDPMMPSRLLSAFPEGVSARRCGLAEAVEETRAFLSPGPRSDA